MAPSESSTQVWEMSRVEECRRKFDLATRVYGFPAESIVLFTTSRSIAWLLPLNSRPESSGRNRSLVCDPISLSSSAATVGIFGLIGPRILPRYVANGAT